MFVGDNYMRTCERGQAQVYHRIETQSPRVQREVFSAKQNGDNRRANLPPFH